MGKLISYLMMGRRSLVSICIYALRYYSRSCPIKNFDRLANYRENFIPFTKVNLKLYGAHLKAPCGASLPDVYKEQYNTKNIITG